MGAYHQVIAPHLQYGRYVLRHKWFVFRAGLRVHAPLWRLIIHDWSKMTPAEWPAYVHTFYGDRPSTAATRADFDRAWLHHQHRNPHHWQAWVLRQDSGIVKALEMPSGLVREMVADWMGAGRAITGEWGVRGWYGAHATSMVLHPNTRDYVEELLLRVGAV